MGMKSHAILSASADVSRSIFFAAAIIIAAFLPLFTLSGVEGNIFGPMARTYAYALAGGLLATFTITPALSAIILPSHMEETETRIMLLLHRIYGPVLNWAVGNRKLVMVGAIGLVVMTVVFGRLLGLEFLPKLEEGNLWIRATLPPTISLEEGNAYVNQMRKLIRSFPQVEAVVSQHGRPDDGTDAAGFFNAEFFAPLKPASEWPDTHDKDELTARIAGEAAGQVSRCRIQLLAVSAGQRLRGRLRREGRELHQIVRQRSAGADRHRQQDQVRALHRAGHYRPCGVHLARPADGPDRYRPRQGRALRARAGRYQRHHQGRDRRRHRGRSL